MNKIIFEDRDFLVAEKSAGIFTQPQKNSSLTLAHWVARQYPEIQKVGGLDWGAVHRLDFETSGLVIFARGQRVYDYFREQFSRNKIEKEYLALVSGKVLKKGKIHWPIGSDPASSKRVKVYKNRKEAIRHRAQEAVTRYEPLSLKGDKTQLKVKIKTGRRHQIRAHLSALGHPVVGDRIYGGMPADRLYLHAHRLRFRHPHSPGKWMEIVS